MEKMRHSDYSLLRAQNVCDPYGVYLQLTLALRQRLLRAHIPVGQFCQSAVLTFRRLPRPTLRDRFRNSLIHRIVDHVVRWRVVVTPDSGPAPFCFTVMKSSSSALRFTSSNSQHALEASYAPSRRLHNMPSCHVPCTTHPHRHHRIQRVQHILCVSSSGGHKFISRTTPQPKSLQNVIQHTVRYHTVRNFRLGPASGSQD